MNSTPDPSSLNSQQARSLADRLTHERMNVFGDNGNAGKYAEHFSAVLGENPDLAKVLQAGNQNTLQDIFKVGEDGDSARRGLLAIGNSKETAPSTPATRSAFYEAGGKRADEIKASGLAQPGYEYATAFKQVSAQHPELLAGVSAR